MMLEEAVVFIRDSPDTSKYRALHEMVGVTAKAIYDIFHPLSASYLCFIEG